MDVYVYVICLTVQFVVQFVSASVHIKGNIKVINNLHIALYDNFQVEFLECFLKRLLDLFTLWTRNVFE